MFQKITKIISYSSFCIVYGITLSSLQAQFKTYWPGKVVHISTSSSKFLKKMVPKFQNLLDEKNTKLKNQNSALSSGSRNILDMLACFAVSNPICGADIEHLGQLIFNARAPLIMSIKSGAKFDQKSRVQNALLKEIGLDLNQALKQVYIGTAKSELAQICDFLINPKKEAVIYNYGLIQELISYFDAVSVTEYDFIVLCQCALFVLSLVD